MSVNLEIVQYKCDWINEFGHTCEHAENFDGRDHREKARDAGWGAYTNAYVRRVRWETGIDSWFCPVHATVFRNNHGWGGLESYKPPTRWWKNFTERKP